MKNFVAELRWRGMLHDTMPGTEEKMLKSRLAGYVGIDPTADSLHIGHLVSIMMLRHLQEAGHTPIALIGGATGMIGDPSGKSKERKLLDEATLRHNQKAIGEQLARFLDFDPAQTNAARLVNNYDWMKDFSFLGFLREVGKHLTVNYMMAKDSVKKRLSGEGEGMSFTEFTYQLVQGYDFLHLYRHQGCQLQMGGSDQWGNITTGTELIRRSEGGEAYALTCPLITKADGGKFGKTEEGNVWLDPQRTSPYQFYQFWLNASDADAGRYLRIFTLLDKPTIERLEAEHQEAPHQRLLQKRLAGELTTLVHGPEALNTAQAATQILFGKSTETELRSLEENQLLEIFEGVPQFEIPRSVLEEGVAIVELLATHSQVFPSKGEARKMLKANGVSLNKTKVGLEKTVSPKDLLNERYLLAQKGKKNYFLLQVKP
jgi:tyrosyl-tRNA synthetase